MARFTFPLDAALRQRVRQEQAAQVALAQAVTAHRSAVEQLAVLARHAEQAAIAPEVRSMIGMGEVRSGLSPITARMNALYYLDQCAQRVHGQRLVTKQRAREVQQARGALVQAAQRRQALERLRERRQKAFDEQSRRRADRQLDELVTLRHGSLLSRGARSGEDR